MKLISVSGLILISIVTIWAHADRLPNPPGPAYGGFIPGGIQYKSDESATSGCG